MTPSDPDAGRVRNAAAGGDATTFALAVLLAALAGLVDATGYTHFHRLFVSFMSGNSTQAVVALAGGDLARFATVGRTLVLFMAGAAAGELVAAGSERWGRSLVLLVELGLLGATLLVVRDGWSEAWATSALALAMGNQNAAVHRAEGISVALTYVTGTLVHVARGIAAALRGAAPWRAVLPYAGLWLGLVCGGFAGAVAASRSLDLALGIAIATCALLLACVSVAAAFAGHGDGR